MTKFGYVRVSTKEQNIDRQMSAMEAVRISTQKIYIDRLTGKNFNRPQYKKLVKKISAGDELYIKSIDRLGRNYEEILEEWRYLTRVKDANIVVLDFPLLDTRNKAEGITGKFIADLVLQILSYVAEVERENTHQRQMEGIREAKNRGVKFGRPKAVIPENFEEVVSKWENEEISLREAARQLHTNHVTLSRWIEKSCNAEHRV